MRSTVVTIFAGLALWMVGLPACSGDMGGGDEVGDTTSLESGDFAVEPDTENVYFVHAVYDEELLMTAEEEEDALLSKVIYRIFPDNGALEPVLDVTTMDNVSVGFGAEQILVTGLDADVPTLRRLDSADFRELEPYTFPNGLDYTAVSPGRGYLAGVEIPEYTDEGALVDEARVYLLDARGDSVVGTVLDTGETWDTAAWLNGSDSLLVLIDPSAEGGDFGDMRLLRYDLSELSSSAFEAAAGGLWDAPVLDLQLPQMSGEWSTLLGRLDVSPDDQWAVIPSKMVAEDSDEEAVAAEDESTPVDDEEIETVPTLQIVDLDSGSVTSIVDAQGPVGFTPDSSTIVSYTYLDVTGDDGQTESVGYLLLIDTGDFSTELVEVPYDGDLSYYVTSDGNMVILDSIDVYNFEGEIEEHLVIFDIDNGTFSELQTDVEKDVNLSEFAVRPGHSELWIEDEGLFRLSYDEAVLEEIPLEWNPDHLNILPSRDQLVIGDADESIIRFLDMETRSVVETVRVD